MAAPTWPHWQLQLLKAAGLPATGDRPAEYFYGTINWLSNWHDYSTVLCDRNPLNMSWREPGSTRCRKLSNGKYARYYVSRASAASAFAEQLNLTDFPEIRKALGSGDPRGYDDQAMLALDVEKWGSPEYADNIRANAGVPVTTPPGSAQQQADNVSGAWTHLNRVLSREGHETAVELQRATAALRRIERRLGKV